MSLINLHNALVSVPDHDVHVEMAVKHPEREGINIHHPFTVKLDNAGVIRSLVNGVGPAATEQGIPTRLG